MHLHIHTSVKTTCRVGGALHGMEGIVLGIMENPNGENEWPTQESAHKPALRTVKDLNLLGLLLPGENKHRSAQQ